MKGAEAQHSHEQADCGADISFHSSRARCSGDNRTSLWDVLRGEEPVAETFGLSYATGYLEQVRNLDTQA